VRLVGYLKSNKLDILKKIEKEMERKRSKTKHS